VQGRINWLAQCLEEMGYRPKTVLEFGCGVGTNAPFLLALDGVEHLLGVDVSEQSLEAARGLIRSRRAQFLSLSSHRASEESDLVFTNGVFHHIAREERLDAIRHIHRSLSPGGVCALWENNPWNLGTRYVMSRIPFDRDAMPLSFLEGRRPTADPRRRTGAATHGFSLHFSKAA
jgi:SAM-dependent methyltransferase